MGNGIIAGNLNLINRDDLASLRYFILGEGVFTNANEGCNFSETHTTKSITIGKGLLCAYGYPGYLKDEKTFTFVNANTVQYWFIYAELNLSVLPNSFDLKRINNGRSTEISLRQDVLSNETNGVFQIPLWRVKIERTGITEVVDLRGIDAYITERDEEEFNILYALLPDYVYTRYIHNPYTGEYSFDETDKISKADIARYTPYYHPAPNNPQGAIEVRRALVLYYIRDVYSVKSESAVLKIKPTRVHACIRAYSLRGLNPKILNTVQGVTQSTDDNSKKIATTEFVKNAIAAAITNI